MTTSHKWEKKGGLYLAVTQFDKADPEHREAALTVLRSSVQTIANTHGAEFNNRAFHNNLDALYSGDIRLDFYLAKWEVTEHAPPIYLGAALSWDTVGIDQNGNYRRALYGEDVCLLTGQLRRVVGGKPDDQEYPNEGIAQCLEEIHLQRLAEQGIAFKYGEVDPDNTRMMQAMCENGGQFGQPDQSGVLEFQKLPSGLIDKLPMDIRIIGLKRDGKTDKNTFIARYNTFIARYNEHGHDIRFIVTRGQATATGQHRVDIRPWHSGVLPSPEILECIVASALRAIKHEVEVERKWGQQYNGLTSPTVPLLGSSGEICRSVYNGAREELLTLSANRPKSFDLSIPDAHVFVINDKAMLEAFMDVGAVPRRFGNKPMMPGVNILEAVC